MKTSKLSFLSCFTCGAQDDHDDVAQPSSSQTYRRSDGPDGLVPRSRREAAATDIQRSWRGAQERDAVAEESASHTPYENRVHYQLATHGYSAEARQRNDRIPGSTETEWAAYQSTASLGPRAPALLSSHQRRAALDEAVSALYGGVAPEGAECQPNGIHTMRANSAWLIGLAHRNVPAVLTTPVERNTLVRYDMTSTALARELVGMTNSGHFEVADGGPWQALTPTDTASSARLEDFRTPASMSLADVKRTLDERGIDTSRLG